MKHSLQPNDESVKETRSEKRVEPRTNSNDTLYFGSIAEAMSAAGPEGSSVCAVGFESTDFLLRAGYRVVDSEPDIVIATGGEKEFDGARGAAHGAKLILVPTHSFPAAAADLYRTTDSAFALMLHGKKPFAAVFDETLINPNLASVFGEILALDLCAFDLIFGERMRGEPADEKTAESIATLVTETAKKLEGREKDKTYAAHVLTCAGSSAAKIVEKTPGLLHCSGAAQTAEALRMLCVAEDRPLNMRGETEAVLSRYIADFYIKSLVGPSEICFPPDNNKRIDSLCEYFNADIRRACVYMSPIYPPIKMRLCEYRRDEFRQELFMRLSAVRDRQTAAWQVFKRLYDDDGFHMKTLVERTDLGICMALAPDVFSADSMLSFIKQTGKLEEYIV